MKILNGICEVWRSIPQIWRYALAGTASFAASMAGVIVAASRHQWTEGGRGGALATIIAIFIVLLRPDYGHQLFEDRMKNIDPNLPLAKKLEYEMEALVAAMRVNSQGQARLNKGLVIASTIGTLFWGFGDIPAKWLIDFHLF